MTDELAREEKKIIKEANKDMKKLVKYAPIIVVAAVFLFLGYIIATINVPQNGITSITGSTNMPTKDAVKADMMSFIQGSLLSDGATASLVSMEDVNGMYKMDLNLTYNGQSQAASLFVTKDGQMYTIQLSNVSAVKAQVAASKANTTTTDTPAATTNVPKTDKPKVELFVMAYCPYGTQIEKGMLPVANLLGAKIDFSVKFVNYAMHGDKEVYEELLQYCIMQQQPAKYNTYLACFLGAGNATACLNQIGVTNASLAKCQSDTDAKYNITGLFNDKSTWLSGYYPQFNIFSADNVKYGVQGSPTLVINGVQSSAARDSESLLKAVCGAFSTQPSACSTVLNSTSPSTGFGYTAGSATAATCG